MTVLHRCTRKSCRARRSLKRHIDDYIRIPKCEECGGDLKPDNWQMKKSKEMKCDCDGISFPHRKGYNPWCNYATREPTEREYKERYG